MHFRDMARVQADLLREQQERDAERKLWEEKETEFRNQVLSADERRHHALHNNVSRYELARIAAMERRYHRILQTLAEARAERDHMVGRASGALWKIRQNERTAEQLKRDRNVAVEELNQIKEKFDRIRKRRGKPDYNQAIDSALGGGEPDSPGGKDGTFSGASTGEIPPVTVERKLAPDELIIGEDGLPLKRPPSAELVGNIHPFLAPYSVRKDLHKADRRRQKIMLVQDAEFRRRRLMPHHGGSVSMLEEQADIYFENLVFEESVRQWVSPSPRNASIQSPRDGHFVVGSSVSEMDRSSHHHPAWQSIMSSSTDRSGKLRSASPRMRSPSPTTDPEVLQLLRIQGSRAIRPDPSKKTLGPVSYKGSYEDILHVHHPMEETKAADWLLRPARPQMRALGYTSLDDAWESLKEESRDTRPVELQSAGLAGSKVSRPYGHPDTRPKPGGQKGMSPIVLEALAGQQVAGPSTSGALPARRPGTHTSRTSRQREESGSRSPRQDSAGFSAGQSTGFESMRMMSSVGFDSSTRAPSERGPAGSSTGFDSVRESRERKRPVWTSERARSPVPSSMRKEFSRGASAMSKSMSDFDDLRLDGGRLADPAPGGPARLADPAPAGGSTIRVAKTGGFHSAKLAPMQISTASQEPIGVLEGSRTQGARKAGSISTPHLPQVSGAPPVTVNTYAQNKALQ